MELVETKPNIRLIRAAGIQTGGTESTENWPRNWLLRRRPLRLRGLEIPVSPRLIPVSACLGELPPRLKQWHGRIDPEYNPRMDEFFEGFVYEAAR